MPRTTKNAIALVERRVKALELRKSGLTFEQIGDACNTSRSTAHEDVVIAMRETIQEPADEVRRIELERLDVMLAALWPKATTTGDRQQARAVEQCLSIMDRRARLLGLDAPTRRVVDLVTHDAFAQAMAELEAEIAELEQDADRSDATGAGRSSTAA